MSIYLHWIWAQFYPSPPPSVTAVPKWWRQGSNHRSPQVKRIMIINSAAGFINIQGPIIPLKIKTGFPKTISKSITQKPWHLTLTYSWVESCSCTFYFSTITSSQNVHWRITRATWRKWTGVRTFCCAFCMRKCMRNSMRKQKTLAIHRKFPESTEKAFL